MENPRLYIDFNEMIEPDLYLLSVGDSMTNSHGEVVSLYEGLQVFVYSDDIDENGNIDNLVASGTVEINNQTYSWSKHVKWCCRIDKNGIRHESEINKE